MEITIEPPSPNYPPPINPTKEEFSQEMGDDLIRAIAWQEWANSVCNPTDFLRWAHYCPKKPEFENQYYVISNKSGDFGVMQINQYWWKDFFNNPKNKSGDHIGWDWTIRDWRENIKDGIYIAITQADKCIEVYWSNLPQNDPLYPSLLDHVRAGIYHHGCGWLRDLVRFYPEISERKEAVYTYSPDGTNYVNWVKEFMKYPQPWNKIP